MISIFMGNRLLTVNDEPEYLGMELTKFTDEYGSVSTWFEK